MEGSIHHFSAGGLYNGLVLLIDDETGSYWDHITGESVHGPLTGKRLEQWGIEMTTVGAVKSKTPELRIFVSRQNLKARLAVWFMNLPFTRGRFPPGFRGTMAESDQRLDEMCIGLGVITDRVQRFYPKSGIGNGIDDEIEGRRLRVAIGECDAVPFAVFTDDDSRPLQLFSRWYGFSLTYKDCEIYAPS